MIRLTITYKYEELFDLCAGYTLSRVYNNEDKDKNNSLLDLYGITEDDAEVFEKHCLKPACNFVYMALKKHAWGQPPFEYAVLDNVSGNSVIIYRIALGRVQESPAIEYSDFNDIISDYMALTIRDFALKEWYKLKGNFELASFHEGEFEINKRKLLDFTQGSNSDTGGVNFGTKPGYPFN